MHQRETVQQQKQQDQQQQQRYNQRQRNVPSNMLQLYIKLLLKLATICFLLTSNVNAAPAIKDNATQATTTAIIDIDDAAVSSGKEDAGLVIGANSLAAAAASAAAAYAAGVSLAHNRLINGNSNFSENVAFTSIGSTGSYGRSSFSDQHNNNYNNYNQNHLNSNENDLLAKSANLLLEDSQHPTGYIVNLTRHHDGDVFRTHGVATCNADTCVGLSSGTAGLRRLGGDRSDALGSASATLAGGSNSQLELLTRRLKTKPNNGIAGETCECRCLSYLSTYREDLGICVDDVHECTLSPFVSGSSSEKIPFVFLPLRGQIIYPSREISFPGMHATYADTCFNIHTPVCAVTSAQYLTSNGWSDLRNPIDNDYPFRMFRDEGRTFLQWLGENDLRQKMQGRLIVVHLVCRDMTVAFNLTNFQEHIKPPKNVFSPCVAFRVNGSPVKYEHNVSEVLFQAETTTTLASTSDGMSTKEYVVIGVCSLLLGLIYVSSVFLYLHMKKRKNREQNPHMRNSLDDLANEINYPKNDQVTFGAPFHRSGSLYSATSLGTSNEPRSRASIGSLKEEMGIVKNNPLLQHFPQLSEHNSGFASDISNSASECEMDGAIGGGGVSGVGGSFHDKLKKLQTAAMVHPQMGSSNQSNGSSKHTQQSMNATQDDESPEMIEQTQENECIPAENVAIVEDMLAEDKLENLRAMVNGNVRKKLYFNPAYFEPHLLAQPPPAAVEFLHKIREVIAIAKYKMASKRYQPSLIMIPEESTLSSNATSIYGSQMQSQQQQIADCQACSNNRCNGHVKNCGEKRNSIEKWLESVPTTENQKNEPNKESTKSTSSKELCEENLKSASNSAHENNSHRLLQSNTRPPTNRHSPRKEITPPRERPPPPPPPSSRTKPSNPAAASTATTNFSLHKPNTATVNNSGSSKQSNGVSIPVNRHYESFSALSVAANMYGFAETGTDIYNNPKFILNASPSASQRSRSSQRSRKRLEALDQFAAASTPTSLNSADRQHYDMLRDMKQVSDIGFDTMQRDYTATMSSNGSFHLDIPTPDYDSTIEKKIKDIYNNTQSSAPSVPTPDYSTLSRKSLKHFQPDSPIYRRKSPQYLIVDYETDSLERLESPKRKSSQSSSSPSSDVSSQMSPSLSTALPLEEELEISHTVYDKVNGFRKEGDSKKKLALKTEEKFSKQKQIAARIKYDTPFRGSMTIEVEHEPPSDLERSTDSDQFEPDTLDRKPKKQSFCDVNAWPPNTNKITHAEYTQMHSLPDMNCKESPLPQDAIYGARASFILKGNNSFRSQSERSPSYESHVEMHRKNSIESVEVFHSNFDHIRGIYESPLMREHSQKSCKCGGQYSQVQATTTESENGRLLTLEAKHSRRQRLIPQHTPPPVVEITKLGANKTTIKISTPKATRATAPMKHGVESAIVEPQVHQNYSPVSKNLDSPWSTKKGALPVVQKITATNSLKQITIAENAPKKRIDRASLTPPPPPPPPPSTISPSTTLTSQTSNLSGKMGNYYQNQQVYGRTSTTPEDEAMSEHSQTTEMTRISDTLGNSELESSRPNTLTSPTTPTQSDKSKQIPIYNDSIDSKFINKNIDSPHSVKKLQHNDVYDPTFNTKINGLRNDYSLNRYLSRRKSQSPEVDKLNGTESHLETNNNNNTINNKQLDNDASKLDVISISSRSNRSSSHLSDRTKELYRNSGVPVGIAYPQRSTVATNSSNQILSSVQSTVYRCEIEPVQLTHGMQIAMGLKDRAKKAKDIKNAWKKFVSRAAAKFSPTQSPAPPFDKKLPSFLEVLDRDEGISSLIDDVAQQSSTPKSSYSAPASHNYYEQRFGNNGIARPGELDSGYMSADSAEVYKRSFYDRYNFKMMSGRDHIIRVDTIEDNSDGGSTLTDRQNGSRRSSILDDNRFEDLEHMEPTTTNTTVTTNYENPQAANSSDSDSDRTLTRSDVCKRNNSQRTIYSSEDEQAQSIYGSSETDGETNVEDMWESGAESIETHSVLYKNVRKS